MNLNYGGDAVLKIAFAKMLLAHKKLVVNTVLFSAVLILFVFIAYVAPVASTSFNHKSIDSQNFLAAIPDSAVYDKDAHSKNGFNKKNSDDIKTAQRQQEELNKNLFKFALSAGKEIDTNESDKFRFNYSILCLILLAILIIVTGILGCQFALLAIFMYVFLKLKGIASPKLNRGTGFLSDLYVDPAKYIFIALAAFFLYIIIFVIIDFMKPDKTAGKKAFAVCALQIGTPVYIYPNKKLPISGNITEESPFVMIRVQDKKLPWRKIDEASRYNGWVCDENIQITDEDNVVYDFNYYGEIGFNEFYIELKTAYTVKNLQRDRLIPTP